MRPIPLAAACVAILSLPSCASIFANGAEVLQLTSSPSGIAFTTDYGESGITPASLTPPSALRQIRVTLDPIDGEPRQFALEKRISGWVFGNALLGLSGILGIAIDAGNPSTRVWPDAGLWHVDCSKPIGTPEVGLFGLARSGSESRAVEAPDVYGPPAVQQ